MTRVRPWHTTGWLPELEIIEWPRLEQHRAAHAAAVESLDAAREVGDAAERDAAMARLCDAVEAIVGDLGRHIGEAGEAYEEAAATARPKTTASGRDPLGGFDVDAQNARAAEVNGKITAEQTELRPRRQALERDGAALNRIRGIVERDTLHEAGIMARAQAEVEHERQRIAKATAAGPTLEQRVERLEAESSAPPAPTEAEAGVGS